MDQLQRTYTKKEIRLIKRSFTVLKTGKSFCFKLLEARCRGEITELEYKNTLWLNQRCPFHTSGTCENCKKRIDQGGIDLFQAVRDIGIKRVQLNLDESHGGNALGFESASSAQGHHHPVATGRTHTSENGHRGKRNSWKQLRLPF